MSILSDKLSETMGNYRKLSGLMDDASGQITIPYPYFNYWNYQTGITTIGEDHFDLK